MTDIEKVARVLAELHRERDQQRAVESGCDILLLVDSYLPAAREDARAALRALLPPSEAMVEAGKRAIWAACISEEKLDADGIVAAKAFTAMLGAVLKDEGK